MARVINWLYEKECTFFRLINGRMHRSSMEQLFLEGSIEQRNEALQVLINKCKSLQDLEIKEQSAVFIKIDKKHHSPDHLNAIKKILDQSKGNVPVVLIYEETRQKVQISQKINATEDLLSELQSVTGEGNVAFKRN